MSNQEIASGARDTLDADLATARALQECGDVDQALQMLARIRERFPTHPVAYLRAAYALADAGHFDNAEVVLLEGRSRVEGSGPVFASEFARMAVRRKDTQEAVRRWKLVRQAFPDHPIGWVGGVEVLRECGQVDEAELLLDEVRTRFPTEQATSMLAASLADVRKDWSKSAELWAIARAQLPQNPIGYIKGGKALFYRNELDKSDTLLADAVKRFPTNAELVAQWAELAAYRHQWSAAAERWTLLRERQPDNALGYIKGAEALIKVENIAKAEAVMVEAIDRFPDRRDLHMQRAQHADVQLGLARALAAQDRLDEAEALFRESGEKFPTRHEVFIEYAALASRRHNWAEALKRWRDAQRRFPQIKNLAHRVFEAELRVVETAGPAAAPVAVQPEQLVSSTGAPDMRAVVTRFESLGGTLHGCEFGLFQRDCSAEPLGLLRWTEMGPDNLIAGLEASFEGVGLPENTELGVNQTIDGPEYFTRDKRFMMSMHTFIKETEISHAKMFGQCCRRLQFLRDKLVADLRAAEKIFVYKITWRVLSQDELVRLHAAVRCFGNATLLYVQREVPGKPHGTVELAMPGLMMGYIDRFSASPTGESLGPATASWSSLCCRALKVSADFSNEAAS